MVIILNGIPKSLFTTLLKIQDLNQILKEPQEHTPNILVLTIKLMIFIGLLHLLNSELEEQLTILYQEVRNNKITREEAVNLVRKFDSEFPQRFFPRLS